MVIRLRPCMNIEYTLPPPPPICPRSPQTGSVDGVTVLSKSGNWRWEFLKRFLRNQPLNAEYEVHVVVGGIQVQLRGETICSVAAGDQPRNADPQGNEVEDDLQALHRGRIIWGITAEDIIGLGPRV